MRARVERLDLVGEDRRVDHGGRSLRRLQGLVDVGLHLVKAAGLLGHPAAEYESAEGEVAEGAARVHRELRRIVAVLESLADVVGAHQRDLGDDERFDHHIKAAQTELADPEDRATLGQDLRKKLHAFGTLADQS